MQFRSILAAGVTAFALVGAAAQAQTAASPAKPAAKSAAAPQPKYDPKDLTGIWMQARGRPFTDYGLTPEYQAILQKRQDDGKAGHPFQVAGTTCLPAGLVASMTTGAYPIEIYAQPGGKELLFQKEIIGAIYHVYLNRQHKPDDELYPMFYGDSVGHWEGNTLVVDTVALGASGALDLITPHSDALHVVQRFTRPSYDTLVDVMTLDDKKALTKPITGTVTFKRHDDWELNEYECTNERFSADAKLSGVAGADK